MRWRNHFFRSKNLVPIFSFILGCYLTTIFTLHNCSTETEASSPKNSNSYLLVIVILSAPKNFIQRQAIRETWLNFHHQYEPDGSLINSINIPQYQANGFIQQDSLDEQRQKLNIFRNSLNNRKTISHTKRTFEFISKFAIGVANLPGKFIESLHLEQNKHSDLLILNDLDDNYGNLTEKVLLSFEKSIANYRFKYLLKCDDDTYVRLEDILTELDVFDMKLNKHDYGRNPLPMLYWGYFNGRAQVKHHGKWTETNFDLCDRYLPYALGGGYIVSHSTVQYLSKNRHILSKYGSEDISMGVWLSSLRNVYRKHDIRFDTGYMPRKCQNYHIMLHKRTISDFRDLYRGFWCHFKGANDTNIKRPDEYFYTWNTSPLQCCNNIND